MFWQKLRHEETFIVVVVLVTLVIVLVMFVNVPELGWTDHFKSTKERVWELAKLLIIPGTLGLIAYYLNKRQYINTQELAARQEKSAQAIAKDQIEEAALQKYFDRMTMLLLEKELRDQAKDSEVSSLAEVRTLTVLRRMNGERKRNILHFLYESGLIMATKQIVNLHRADLTQLSLVQTNLEQANLAGANFTGANLSGNVLAGAILEQSNLTQVNLTGADLTGANLTAAKLTQTDLTRANLTEADLTQANLKGAKLTDTTLTMAKLTEAEYNNTTQWPDGFNPEKAGAINTG